MKPIAYIARSPKPPVRRAFTCRIEKKLRDEVETTADSCQCSVNKFVEAALRYYIDHLNIETTKALYKSK